MTKQEFLNAEAKTGADQVAKCVLQSHSPTAIKQLKRDLATLNKALYTDAWKKLPLTDVVAGVERAIFYALD